MEGTNTNVEDYYVDDKKAVQETIQQCIPIRIATADMKLDIKPFFL